jgi:hypothetical protein
MKVIICTAALLLFGSVSHARGTPSSSFVPRGPEPHASLNDKHHAIKNKHAVSQGAVHQGGYKLSPKAGSHVNHTPPHSR